MVTAAADGRVSLSSINFREDNGENSSPVPPSKFAARYLKANKSKSYWSGSFEEPRLSLQFRVAVRLQ